LGEQYFWCHTFQLITKTWVLDLKQCCVGLHYWAWAWLCSLTI